MRRLPTWDTVEHAICSLRRSGPIGRVATAPGGGKARQDRLGLGWGNHDHHTYRSSREQFAGLIRVFEVIGLLCRERFYAGIEAGWGG
jgi:hypothetical protein